MPTKAIDYNKTVIYKIVCNNTAVSDLYVGSTTDFTSRKSSHKSGCTNENNKEYDYKKNQVIRLHGGWENWSMIEIEKFPCKDGNEARGRERYWYNLLNTRMNSIRPSVSCEEKQESMRRANQDYYKEHRDVLNNRHRQYNVEHKDELQQYQLVYNKAYYEKKKDALKEKMRQYYNENKAKTMCECGLLVSSYSKNKHKQSQQHLNNISKPEEF